MNYKCRAECIADAVLAIDLIRPTRYVLESSHPPDAVLTFESTKTMDDIVHALKSLPEGHVMWQTVALEEEYTGVRPIHVPAEPS